ncbi:MAG: class I SAM-dependent methyltransferase [Bacteroidia bacterium]|nr:class I SAM-dependent methyltransferase [Bacteroidia bacterium]
MKFETCPICSSKDIFEYMHGVFDNPEAIVKECRTCGLQYLYPMFTDEEEDVYYRNYYESQSVRHFKSNSLKDMQDAALRLYNNYEGYYKALLENTEAVLEVGCGTGGFIKFLASTGENFLYHGVERSESNLTFLREYKHWDTITPEFFETFGDLPAGQQYDLVTAFGVLEHVRFPDQFLEELILKVRPGGRVVFNVPNKNNPLVSWLELEEFRKFTYMMQHCYTFTEESLKTLGKRHHLAVKEFNYQQVWSLDNHLSWLKNRKPHDFSRFTRLLSPETIASYNRDLIRNKETDLVSVVFNYNP